MITVVTPLFGDGNEQSRLQETRRSLASQTVEIEHLIVGGQIPRLGTEPSMSGVVSRSLVVPSGGDWLSASLAAAANNRCAVLFPGDRCAPNAFAALSEALDSAPTPVALAYADHRLPPTEPPPFHTSDADETLESVANHRADVMLKPAPSPEYLLGKNFVANAAIVDREQLDRGPFAADPVDAVHDLVLRAAEIGAVQVAASLFDLSGPIGEGAASPVAVERAIRRAGATATVVAGQDGTVRVRYHCDDEPLVSVIIPTRGSVGREWGATRSYLVDAVESICERSSYQALEFIIVYDSDTPPAAIAAVEQVAGQRTRFVEYSRPFNFSDKINVGVAASTGDFLLLLNDDTELIEPGTIHELVALVQRPGVGAVGARLLYADATLQHGGHVYSGEMLHACEGWPGSSPGPRPLTPLAITRETTGVTAAAAMVRRSVFDEVGGFSPEFPVNFNDVDFCLKLIAAGYRNLWTPNAVWYHFESVSRGRSYADAEVDRIFDRWAHELQHDRYYNPNLIPKRADWLEQPGLTDW